MRTPLPILDSREEKRETENDFSEPKKLQDVRGERLKLSRFIAPNHGHLSHYNVSIQSRFACMRLCKIMQIEFS